MPECFPRVEMVRHTAQSEELIALGARLCYAGGDVDELSRLVSKSDQQAFLRKIMEMGHESVLEHVSFTFLAEGVSRTLLAQLTRHRIASFSVQSQRYVSYDKGFGYIIPPSVKALGTQAVADYEDQMAQMQQWYEEWQRRLAGGGEGTSNEDARFILPGACETRVLMTMNARELRHFFALRMCRRAQWEIRAMAAMMFEQCYRQAPVLFEDAGPGCLRHSCPEGKKTCGLSGEMRRVRRDWIENSAKAAPGQVSSGVDAGLRNQEERR
ncbi:MAG: FAD-dependent thymidylate synthase [Clostridia bacterium]|nr:FAD-dependent thymidylate synthase [Clostridia bacterium]